MKYIKKIVVILIAIVLALGLLATCESNNEETASVVAPGNQDGDQWTVFVYLCGTDLESTSGMATYNMEEMLGVTLPENVKVIMETGGANQWAIEGINPDKLERYELQNGGFLQVDEQPLASMGKAETLGGFLQWGVEKYPADKYMCLIWNHGGGSVAGVAFDERFEYDSLDLKELAAGIAAPGVQFEIIGFDACLMSTLETAAALAPYGRYMVASEEIEPGTGWDYTAMLQYLSENPAKSGLDVGKAICDSYFAKCKLTQDDALATLAVTDLVEVSALVEAFDEMAAQIEGITQKPEDLQTFEQAMVRAENYGGNNKSEGYTNMVDLGDLVNCAKGVLPATGEKVLAGLQSAVKYKVDGESRAKSNGLSVFVPLEVSDDDLNNYAEIAVSGHYLRFFEAMYDWTIPQGLEIESTIKDMDVPAVEKLNPKDFNLEFSTSINQEGNYVLQIDQGADIIQSVAYNLYYLDDATNAIIFLGSDYDLNYDEESGLYWDNFRNVWPGINKETCSMTPIDWTEDYILYTIPIKLNGEYTNLRMSYYYAGNTYEVHGAWDGIDGDTGMSSKELRKLQDGDQIEFVFGALVPGSEEPITFQFGGFTVNGPVTVEEAPLFDATFYYDYEITDIFGRTYTSDFAVINSQNGQLTIEELE